MDTVAEVLKKSQHPETRCFIVDTRHDKNEYGIVLLSDIAKQVLARNESPERVNIDEIMSKPVVRVDPNMDIRYCACLFKNPGLGRTPVIDDGKVVSIVGFTDIVLHGIRDRLP